MSFSQRSWIAAALLPDDVANKAVDVRSDLVLFGSTSGPFGGIGGSAMTYFQMTLIVLPDAALVFADDRLLGWAPFTEQDARWRIVWRDLHENKDRLTDRLTDRLQPPETCPIALRD